MTKEATQVDVTAEVAAIRRNVAIRQGREQELVAVLASREFAAPASTLWDAITNPGQLGHWFLPVSGDLRVGGKFQTEGNAGGEILACDAPTRLEVTWGDASSTVELRLNENAGTTRLELEHAVPLAFARNGAGALFVGPGWDGALAALNAYLRGEAPADPTAAASSLETQRFNKEALHAWAAAVRESGTASEEELAGMLQVTLPHWAPNL
ncbi:MAG TPA: SRPBCC family protein [Deinococcales bacterium]|nr:SRPBCC family protein [Deinococcales bacterium]